MADAAWDLADDTTEAAELLAPETAAEADEAADVTTELAAEATAVASEVGTATEMPAEEQIPTTAGITSVAWSVSCNIGACCGERTSRIGS